MDDYENNQNQIDDTNDNGGQPEDNNSWQDAPDSWNNTNTQWQGSNTYSQWEGNNAQQHIPYNNMQQNNAPQKKTNTLAVLSMIAGIFSLITCCQPLFGFVLSVAGIVLAVLSKKGQPFSGFAVAGLVLSILGLVASIAMCAYMVFVYSLLKDPEYSQLINDLLKEYYNAMP